MSLPRTPTCLLALLLPLLAGCEEGGGTAPEVPALGTFNAHVVAVLETYPTDGTHGYHWPKTGSWLGTTRTLTYRGGILAEGDPQGRCHCSGLTFEVFFRAWMRWCEATGHEARILDFDLEAMKRFVKAWFGASGDRATLHTALTRHRLGRRITTWEDARRGDFVQLWRHSGSGHSVVFDRWLHDARGEITGLRYWSTQSSTNGIGYREERFGDDGSTVKRDEFYVVRVGR